MKILLLVWPLLLLRTVKLLELVRMNYRIENRMLGVEWWELRNCYFRTGR
jgi:hypothetical protein